MSEIKKKMWPESFEAVLSGDRTYDLRLADWEVHPGDIIIFQERDPATEVYTGRELRKEVGYVGKTKDWRVWSKEEIDLYGYQVLSLKDMNE